MTSRTPADLKPHNPQMAVIFKRAVNAFRAHWKAHGNASPQKLILTREQADDLHQARQYGLMAFPEASDRPRDLFFNRPIEVSETTAGEIVAIDGTTTPLSTYDQIG